MIEQGRGGAVVLTSSAFGLTGRGGDGAGGTDGYVASQARRRRADAHLRHLARPARDPGELREPVRRRHPHGAQPGRRGALRRWRRAGARPQAVADVANLFDVGLVEVDDVTAAVAFLASDEARYITGVALPVDAGMLVR